MTKFFAVIAVVLFHLVTLLAVPEAQAVSKVTQAAPGIPQEYEGTPSDPDMWRYLRRGGTGRSEVPDEKSRRLIQSSSERWRLFIDVLSSVVVRCDGRPLSPERCRLAGRCFPEWLDYPLAPRAPLAGWPVERRRVARVPLDGDQPTAARYWVHRVQRSLPVKARTSETIASFTSRTERCFNPKAISSMRS